ncbi:hypothetical protein LOTGIDRAFT_238051 [Lottia gigantea]|uniref:FYVE-type domain-containing protein n=1 Tax=Lottia gigantea TaxID=225164 RepID=V4B925_LOTGI|nr:hypothetical protein LOTGIDRAFT_238051 [Lottia gigantea]ESP02327.1 hypothetical protein LOTGIDRAFT_238051 [Lottia gigantea]
MLTAACLGSSTVTTPSQLSWLCLIECQNIGVERNIDQISLVTKLFKDADFRLLLAELPPESDASIFKELYEFFRKCNDLVPNITELSSSKVLSKTTLEFLKQFLYSKTDLGHLIISHLMQYEDPMTPNNTEFITKTTGNDFKTRNNEALQGLYLHCINSILDHLDKTEIKQSERIAQFSKLLGYYNPSAYWNYLQLRQLYTRLIEFCDKQDSPLSRNRVISLLMGRHTTYLIDEYCKLEYEILLSVSASKIYVDVRLGEEEKCLLEVCSDNHRETRWRNIFQLSIKKKRHFLEMIMNTSLELVKQERFIELERLLQCEDLVPLKPVILLIAWSYCSSCNIARQLLQVLWNEHDNCPHTIFTSSCQKLSYQIDLIQWCLDKAKPLLESSSSTNLASHERATNMLQNLSTHSVLFVLHQSTRISALNQDEVLHLLQNTSHSLAKEKGKKSVRFRDQSLKTSGDQPISIEQHCDISTFRSYCALKNVMDILAFCAENFEHAMMNPVCLKTSLRPKHLTRIFVTEDNVSSSSDGEDWLSASQVGECKPELSSDDSESFNKLYETNVTKKLTAVKDHLRQLHPLTFRVETMENLFSLLFVTHEDFNSDYVQDNDSGDEEGEVGNKLSTSEISIQSDEEPPPVTKKFSFSRSNSRSDKPTKPSQNMTSSLNYDEPFDDSKKNLTSQSMQQTIASQSPDPIDTPTKKLSITLTSLRKFSTANKSSDFSSSVNSNNMKIGFLANDYIVRDVLAMLKDSLTDLNSAKFTLLGKDSESRSVTTEVPVSPATERLLTQHIKSSITLDILPQRITRLTQLIHEAQWRFQLVCNDSIPRQTGVLLQKQVITSDNDYSILLSSSYNKKERSRSPKKERLGSSSDDREAGNNKQQKSRSQCTSLSSAPCRSIGIIQLMLSSPDSLLSMCLSKGNFGQATQVVKLFKLDKKDETAEVQFSDSYKQAADKLSTLIENPEKGSTSSNRPGTMSIKALASVAAAGVASASLTNITDDLLTLTTVPPFPKPNVPKTHKLLYFFTDVTVSSAILIDLLLTSCKNWDLCNKMCNVIKSKINMKLVMEGDNVMNSEIPVKGCVAYFAEILKVLELGSDIDSHYHMENNPKSNLNLKQSVVDLLLNATTPISAQRLKKYVGIKEEIRQSLEKVETEITILENTNATEKSLSLSRTPSPQTSPRPSPMGSVSSRSSIKPEPPSIHTAIKQLISCMESYLPSGGIIKIVKRSSESDVVSNRNYLLSLYEHVKELAFLVAQSECKSQESLVLPQNYFLTLKEGPILILGRLMFNKKLQPSKLEKVAAKLSLNLTHIIVHSCCPRIPSKHLIPVITPTYSNITTLASCNITIYNSGEFESSTDDPLLLITTVLSSLLQTLKEKAERCNSKGIFDISCAKLLVQDSSFDDLFNTTKQLQSVDLSKLGKKDDLTCFYINLQNLMTIHMHLLFIHHRLQKQKCLEEEESQSNLLKDEDIFTMSSLDNLIQRQQFYYQIGQLGVVSLFDVKTKICNEKFLPTLEISNIPVASYNLSSYDPWSLCSPPTDERLIFLYIDGCVSSPYLQVVYGNSISNQLQITMKEYINHTVYIDLDKKQVTVGQYLMWYKNSSSKRTKSTYSMFKEVTDFILNYLDGHKRDDLQELINLDVNDRGSTENIDEAGRKELPYEVVIQPFNPEFSIIFTSDGLPSIDCLYVPRSKPQTFSRTENSVESLLERPASFVENPSYLLTPTTLDYIKNDSLLVATMVSLVCADELDEIDTHFTDNYFRQESVPRDRTMSDISLVDIRSYRYQRLTDDFPILQRHLLNYILPLAGADNPDMSNSGDPILKFVTNDIDEKVKLCMFSLHDSVQFQDVVNELILRFIQNENYLSVLAVLQSIPEILMKEKVDWKILHDFSLVNLVSQKCQRPNCDNKVINLLRYFYSKSTQVRTILSVCNNLPVETGIDLLELCLSYELSSELVPLVEKQLKILHVYAKIIDSVKNLQFKLSMQTSEFISLENQDSLKSYHSALAPFTDWHYLVKTSQESPKDVLAVLMKTGVYVTAKEWAEINNIPKPLKLDIQERYLVSLLTSDTPNSIKAFQVLEELRKETDDKTCYTICDNLLHKLSDHKHILFLTSYMLNQLKSVVQDNIEDLQLRHIGAKALQIVPDFLRGDYSGLITSPHLILEQLLMNMKADLAGQVFSEIKTEFLAIKDEKLRVTNERFNEMLMKYAKLAVEITVVQIDPERERTQSTDSYDPKREESDLTKSFMESVRIRRRGFELSVSPRTMTPSPSASPRRKISNVYLHPPILENTSSTPTSSPSKFIMPSQPPPPEKWVPDSSASVCMVCGVERFSMFNRRHHCRRCGRVVCAACSTKRTMVQGVSARVCNDCYQQIFGPVNVKPKEPEFYSSGKTPDRLSQTSGSPPPFSSSYNTVTSPNQDGGEVNISMNIAGESEWKLKIDDEHNKFIREEFYFEQAPSVSLSISILNHYSNVRECGHILLKICDNLSKYLQPISPGVPNPEVDYNLIISMISQLLFQAKMKFLKLGDNNGIGQCDMYQTRVDLLKILVESNYRNLPTIEQLTKVDTVRRLRDKLISNERLGLAMEVSTKCGLDPTGVWSAWGMALLQCGDYTAAREKFSHCLKLPKDKNQTGTSSRLLQEIIDHLETLPVTGATEIQMLLSSTASIKTLINMPASTSVEESSMETKQFQECLYYIKTYGTYLELLGMLRRNGYWMKSAEYVLQHKCSSEVFIQGLLEPALKAGDLEKLLDQMLMLDKSLDKWNNYLTATCRYLLKQHYHHALYQIQIFMKDYLRAAMTCITHFYQQGCQSYLDLNKHIQYLFTAQQHMQAYLDPSKWGSVKHPFNSTSGKKGVDWGKSTPENTVRLSLTTDEVNKHIRTIALQIEITQFLDNCLKNREGESTNLATSYVVESQKSHLPSLFGSSKIRTDLVTMILQSGSSVKSGFDLSIRIIKECRLSTTAIFTHTSRELAKHQHYSSIRELHNLINQAGLGDEESLDEIIRAALLILADNQEEAKETENLIKLLKKDTNKINAYILCGKLRSAYLLAVKGERIEDVQRIAGAAQRTGQAAVKNICTKWLQQRKK